MKAFIPKLSKKQKATIREEVVKETERQSKDYARRMFKLLCASLHEEYGFGYVRCMRIIDRISKVSAEHQHDEVFWRHIDIMMEQMKLPFDKEDYEEVDR